MLKVQILLYNYDELYYNATWVYEMHSEVIFRDGFPVNPFPRLEIYEEAYKFWFLQICDSRKQRDSL